MQIGVIANTMSQAVQEMDYFYEENKDQIEIKSPLNKYLWFKDGTLMIFYSRDTIRKKDVDSLHQLFLVDNLQLNYPSVVSAIAEITARTCIPEKYAVYKLPEY